MGHYVLSVVTFGDEHPRLGMGPKMAASHFEGAFVGKCPDLASGGLHSPRTEDELRRAEPPQTFSARKAVTLGDARHGCLSDPIKIIMKLPTVWGHAPAQQLKKELADQDEENMYLANYVDEVPRF